MGLPREFLALSNFRLAWERIIRGSNAQYKRVHSHLFASYNIALDSNLAYLIRKIRSGHFLPSNSTTIYYPKASRILRPITLLCLNDQVLYQAIANYVANKFSRSLQAQYGSKTFGAQFAGAQSPFFYRPWKRCYRQFNNAIRRSYRAGNNVLGDFDLVSFFDLVDHKILRSVLQKRINNGELLDLLDLCLERWTSGSATAYIKGHGIPQGPEPSAFLADLMLSDFDRAGYQNCTYLRYVDDIKILGKDFSSVRRAFLRLDLQAKRLGLVPQAQKIDIRRVTDIRTELKSVPSSIAGASFPARSSSLTPSTIRRLEQILRASITRRRGEVSVRNETHFKFALNRLPPSLRILRLIEPLFQTRPDLSFGLSHFVQRLPNRRRACRVLYHALKSDPVFDASGGDYVRALDHCLGSPGPKRFRALLWQLMTKSEEKSSLLETPCKFYPYRRSGKSFRTTSLRTEPSPLSASQIINRLAFDPNHACIQGGELLPVLRQFSNRSTNEDLCRYCTYLMLSELGRIPSRPQAAGALLLQHLGWSAPAPRTSLLKKFFADAFKLPSHMDWDSLLGKRAHSEAQRRAIALLGRWAGNPSILVTLIDSFNDLLVQRLSKRHAALKHAFKKCAGKNKVPDYGTWLRAAELAAVLPRATPALRNCHKARIRADVAHATQKKSGGFTRPISYSEKSRLLKELKSAYRELLAVWATL